MKVPVVNFISLLTLSAALIWAADATAEDHLWGGVAKGSYGPVIYSELTGVALERFPTLVEHPYQVVVSDTSRGEVILCRLYDQSGEAVASDTENSRDGQTRLYFKNKEPDLTARCYLAQVERFIRPSS